MARRLHPGGGRPKIWTEASIQAALARFVALYGRPPGPGEWNTQGLPSRVAVWRVYGSLAAAWAAVEETDHA